MQMEAYVWTSYKTGLHDTHSLCYPNIICTPMTPMQSRRNFISHLFCRWSPTYDVSAILTSIQSLLSDPNPNSPANSMAAQLFKENRREYEKRVKACVEQSWCDD